MRQRMKREERRDILLNLAAAIIAEQGADALTLQTLAEAAGVTKPVTYNQFGTRDGLLIALYERYDQRFFADLSIGLSGSLSELSSFAEIFARTFLDCVEKHGRIYDASVAALQAFPEHCDIKSKIRKAFCCMLVEHMPPSLGAVAAQQPLHCLSLHGALEELGRALLDGEYTRLEVEAEIVRVFTCLFG